MVKIDFKKESKHLYYPSVKMAEIVDVPMMNFLMINGVGDPNTAQEYKNAVEALFALSYTLKFIVKKEKDIDYVVLPLESLWFTDDITKFSLENKDEWKWISMIMQPEYITKDLVSKALEKVKRRKNPIDLKKIRFESFHERLSAQIMHIGPYSAETPTIEKLHKFITETGHVLRGKHHEIYLSDPHKAKPEKMKTVIRQPLK